VAAWLAGAALGVVLVVAGVSKRADRAWPLKASAFGVPRWAARVLPFVEIALGAVLITGLDRAFAAWLAAFLLIGFTVMLVFRFAQGRRPPCACFGTRSTKPIGPWSVLRNLLLIALAVIAALG
jgi:uncharacterized membrane protein YphA (DoxX/SURF4 family)